MFSSNSLLEPLVNGLSQFDHRNPCKLFVGGINKSTSEQVLYRYFANFGKVMYVDIARSPNGKSKGYGYVEYQDELGTSRALSVRLHLLDSNQLRVEPAYDPEFRQAQHRYLAQRRIYLSGIPSSVTEAEIFEVLREFGTPESVTSLRRSNPYSNPNSFYCYVTMDRPQSAERILNEAYVFLKNGGQILAKPFASQLLNKASKKWGDSTIQRTGMASSLNDEECLLKESCSFDKSISTLGSPCVFAERALKNSGGGKPHDDVLSKFARCGVDSGLRANTLGVLNGTPIFSQPQAINRDLHYQEHLNSKLLKLCSSGHRPQNLRFNLSFTSRGTPINRPHMQ